MNRARDRLTAITVRNASKPGFHHDGGGLYWQVSRFGTKSWILRYTINKKTRDMGLGPLSDWSLAEARERARKFRQQVDDNTDPIEARQKEQATKAAEVASRKTFEECAISRHESKSSAWKIKKHRDQWVNTLSTYAYPKLGKLTVADVVKRAVADLRRPIWLAK